LITPIFGPSGVRALPLAAGINVMAIVLGIIFISEVLTFLLVGVAMGRYIFQKCLISHLSGWFLKI
jgi:hypothetical protein